MTLISFKGNIYIFIYIEIRADVKFSQCYSPGNQAIANIYTNLYILGKSSVI